MINVKDFNQQLLNEVPFLRAKIGSAPKSIYKTVQAFADYTKWHINFGNIKAVKHCFELTEKFLAEGDKQVKEAVQGIYVYTVSRLLDMDEPGLSKLKQLMGSQMKTEYIRQITSCQA